MDRFIDAKQPLFSNYKRTKTMRQASYSQSRLSQPKGNRCTAKQNRPAGTPSTPT